MSEECYSGHAEVPLVNALDECRAERDKLRETGKLLTRACQKLLGGLHAKALNDPEFQKAYDDAMLAARKLGLLIADDH